MYITPCGVDCERCADFKTKCGGCNEIKGEVWWAGYTGGKICPIYDCCVNKSGNTHCGKCKELPCRIYSDTRDPSVSEEQHNEGIKERVKILKSLK